jgi:single stranded DNA-binding protein
MRGMSYVHMAGTVGTTPQTGTTKDGTSWARLRLAVTRWDHRTGQETTDWWTVRLYGQNATRAEKILRPGSGVVFRGVPTQEEWTDKEGVKHRDVSIRAESFEVMRTTQRPDGLPAATQPAVPAMPPPEVPF